MRKFLASTMMAASLAASPAIAQESETGEIVVEGTRAEVRNQIKMILEPSGGQLSSFGRGFCPIVIGFDREWSAHLDTLIRANAEALGLRPLDKGCTPTAVVIFTDEPQQLIQGLRKKMPSLFETLYIPEIKRIADKPRTTYSWRATGPVGRDGQRATSGSFSGDASGAPVIKTFSASRLYSPTNYEIFNSYLIMDIDKTPGMTLQQIADFATMNLLLDLEEEAVSNAPAGSILSLFDVDDPTAVADGMTPFDRGVLKGLYGAKDKSRPASRQRATIARSMTGARDD